MRKKAKRLIRALVERREEVVLRARTIANKQIPEQLIDTNMSDTIEWIVTPHIQEKYERFQKAEDEDVRGFQSLMMKIFKAIGVKNKKA